MEPGQRRRKRERYPDREGEIILFRKSFQPAAHLFNEICTSLKMSSSPDSDYSDVSVKYSIPGYSKPQGDTVSSFPASVHRIVFGYCLH